MDFEGDPEAEAFEVWIDGVQVVDDEGEAALIVGSSYANGVDVVQVGLDDGVGVWLSQDASGDWTLSTTAYADDPDALPISVNVELVSTTGAAFPTADGWDLAFDDEVAVVFAIETELATDAAGMDLVGKVKLQGAANTKGKRQTLAKGKFAGQFGVDADGDTDLGSIDKTGDTLSRGDILIGGEPIDIERTGAPPVIVRQVKDDKKKVKKDLKSG